jgi:PPOX class probable F420-dependent enzyme
VGVTLSDDARSLLDAPNIGHLATLMPGGEPKVEPVWVGREGDLVLVTTDERSLKARNVVRDARVALSVTDSTNPYRQLLVRGRVVELRPDNDLVVLDAFSEQYLGTPFPRRRWSTRVVLVIEPTLARAYTSPLADLVQPDASRRTP